MTSRKIAAFVLCACLLMIGGVFAQEPEPTPTDTPTLAPTDTPTNTDTDTATEAATATSTDTATPPEFTEEATEDWTPAPVSPTPPVNLEDTTGDRPFITTFDEPVTQFLPAYLGTPPTGIATASVNPPGNPGNAAQGVRYGRDFYGCEYTSCMRVSLSIPIDATCGVLTSAALDVRAARGEVGATPTAAVWVRMQVLATYTTAADGMMIEESDGTVNYGDNNWGPYYLASAPIAVAVPTGASIFVVAGMAGGGSNDQLHDVRVDNIRYTCAQPTPTPTNTPTNTPTPTFTPTHTPTPTSTPVPPFTVEISVDAGIPYQQRNFALSLINNTGIDFTDLNVRLTPFTSLSNPIGFTEGEQNIPLRYIERTGGEILYQSPVQPVLERSDLGLAANERKDFLFLGHTKRSGTQQITVQLSSVAQGLTFITQVSVVTNVTGLDFSNADAGLKAAMFWALFNESSEGNEFLFNPESLTRCYQDGWDPPETSAIVLWMIREANSAERRCQDLINMDLQVMLNGIINYERQPSGRAYQYFTGNFEGSLGNTLPEDSDSYYRGEIDDPYNGSNWLWMVAPNCWLPAAELGITNIQHPTAFPVDRIGYRVVLDNDQEIATLPSGFNRERAVLRWLQHYLECYMGSGTGGDVQYQWQYNFYQRIYLGTPQQASVIDQLITDFTNNCPLNSEPRTLTNYLNCDPANGAIGRLGAGSIQTYVDSCVGISPEAVMSSTCSVAKIGRTSKISRNEPKTRE